jgi:hypothetical protein
VGSAYAASSNSFIRWATIDAKEYDEFRLSPEYIDSVQDTTHDSSVPPVPKDVADPVPSDEKASVSGFVTDLGVEQIESLDDNLATSTKISLDTPTDTSNFVSHFTGR